MIGIWVHRERASLLPCRVALGLACAAILAARLAAAQQTAPPKASPVTEDVDAQRALRVLQGSLQQSQDNLRNLASRLPKVQQELDQLINDAQSVQVRKEGKEPKPVNDPPAEKIRYRKPHEQLTQKSGLTFVCENNRISFVDFEEINRTMNSRLAALKGLGKQAVEFDLPDSDFRIEGTIVARQSFQDGEDEWESGGKTDSGPQGGSSGRKLGRGTAPRIAISESARSPKSGRLLRQLRRLARQPRGLPRGSLAPWDHGFDVGWNPMSAGAKMTLTSGIGVGAVQ